ncbi:MAG: DNA repair protein RecO [Gammaproteobacteria bacterium]|nr:DNA repair protein RecO [Gammaproteobacteria bacterium]
MDTWGERGYILHARPWRDTSLLLEVFLREGGRRGVIARGARGNSRLRARLQPFRLLWLDLRGRGELAQLRAAEELVSQPRLVGGRVLACGYYLNELLMRLLPRDAPHPELFDRYTEALGALGSGASEAPILRLFEKQLLEALGWAPAWDCCADGTPVEAERMYHVCPESGVCRAEDGPATVRGASLLHLAAGRCDDPATAREIRLILHGLLAPHLGPRPLRSRELLAVALGVGRTLPHPSAEGSHHREPSE